MVPPRARQVFISIHYGLFSHIKEHTVEEEQLAAHAHLVQFLLRTARRVARVAIVKSSVSLQPDKTIDLILILKLDVFSVHPMDVSKNRGTQNGWYIMESSIKMDDLGVPLFLETSL